MARPNGIFWEGIFTNGTVRYFPHRNNSMSFIISFTLSSVLSVSPMGQWHAKAHSIRAEKRASSGSCYNNESHGILEQLQQQQCYKNVTVIKLKSTSYISQDVKFDNANVEKWPSTVWMRIVHFSSASAGLREEWNEKSTTYAIIITSCINSYSRSCRWGFPPTTKAEGA